VVLYAPWCQFSKGLEPAFAELADELSSDSMVFAKFQADIERDFSAEKFGLKTFPTLVLLPKNSDKVFKYPTDKRDVDTLKMWLSVMTS